MKSAAHEAPLYKCLNKSIDFFYQQVEYNKKLYRCIFFFVSYQVHKKILDI